MASIAEFSVAASTFPLGSLFDDLPSATIELERIVPTGGPVIPYFWVYGVEVTTVEAAVSGRPGVSNIEAVDSVGENVLMRAEWDLSVHGVMRGIVESDAVLLTATGTAEEWRFELRAPAAEAFSEFRSYCRTHGIELSLESLYTLSERNAEQGYGLTEPQLEALLLAFERGYFDSPRRTTLEALGDELGISRQAVADRLRRGHRSLVANTVAVRHEGA